MLRHKIKLKPNRKLEDNTLLYSQILKTVSQPDGRAVNPATLEAWLEGSYDPT